MLRFKHRGGITQRSQIVSREGREKGGGQGERKRVSTCRGMKDLALFWKRDEKSRGRNKYNSVRGKLTGDSVVKNPPAIAGDEGLIPGSGRSLGEGNGNPL